MLRQVSPPLRRLMSTRERQRHRGPHPSYPDTVHGTDVDASGGASRSPPPTHISTTTTNTSTTPTTSTITIASTRPTTTTAAGSSSAHGAVRETPEAHARRLEPRAKSRAQRRKADATDREVLRMPVSCMDCLKLGNNKRKCPHCQRIMAVIALQVKDRRIRMFKRRQRQCAESLLLDRDGSRKAKDGQKQAALGSVFSLDSALDAVDSLSHRTPWRREKPYHSSTPLLDAARAAKGLPVRSYQRSTAQGVGSNSTSTGSVVADATPSVALSQIRTGNRTKISTNTICRTTDATACRVVPPSGACKATDARAKRKHDEASPRDHSPQSRPPRRHSAHALPRVTGVSPLATSHTAQRSVPLTAPATRPVIVPPTAQPTAPSTVPPTAPANNERYANSTGRVRDVVRTRRHHNDHEQKSQVFRNILLCHLCNAC